MLSLAFNKLLISKAVAVTANEVFNTFTDALEPDTCCTSKCDALRSESVKLVPPTGTNPSGFKRTTPTDAVAPDITTPSVTLVFGILSK